MLAYRFNVGFFDLKSAPASTLTKTAFTEGLDLANTCPFKAIC